MPAADAVRILQARGAQAAPLDAEEWRRIAARAAWVRETMGRLKAAQRRVDQAWERMINSAPRFPGEGDHPKPKAKDGGGGLLPNAEHPDLPDPPEQSELDAIHAELRAVIDEDRWPRDLYFGGV